MDKLGICFILVFALLGCTAVIDDDIGSAGYALSEGRYQTAVHFASEVIRTDSLNIIAYIIRGKAYSRLNETDKAMSNFNTALNIEPGFEPYFNRGLEYLKNEDYSAAINDFDRAIEFNNSDKDAYFTRAYTKYLISDLDGAVKDYEKVISLDSASYKAYINMGNILGSLGYGTRAIENFTKAISLQPENPDGYFNRGNQKLIMNDIESGIEDLERSLHFDNRNVKALLMLAELKFNSGDNLGSLESLNKVISLDQNPKAFYLRGLVFLKLEDRSNACPDLQRAGELGFFDAYEMINKYCVKSKKKK